MGGGGKKSSNYNLGITKIWGGLNFSKMSEFKILTFIEGEKGHVFSVENQKCLNLIRVGGGSFFQKCQKFKKV